MIAISQTIPSSTSPFSPPKPQHYHPPPPPGGAARPWNVPPPRARFSRHVLQALEGVHDEEYSAGGAVCSRAGGGARSVRRPLAYLDVATDVDDGTVSACVREALGCLYRDDGQVGEAMQCGQFVNLQQYIGVKFCRRGITS